MSKLRVAFISTAFDNSGIGTYSKALYHALQSCRVDVSAFHIDYNTQRIYELMKKEKRTVKRKKSVWNIHSVPFHFRCRNDIPDGFDIYHITHPGISFLNVKPKIVTCHDMIKYKFPRRMSEKVTREVFYRPLEHAEHVITISNATKQDLISTLNFDRENTTTVYNGVNKNYRPIDKKDDCLRSDFDLPSDEKVVLYIGSDEPRKNLSTLLKGFASLKNSIPNATFVKVGSESTFGDRKGTIDYIKEYGVQDSTKIFDFISEEKLPRLYNTSDVFVFPSLYEGFGLPPLEAMACGTPVITSNAASLPEVVGNAGITIDPTDASQLATELERVLENSHLQNKLTKKGLHRANQFSWKRSANETLDVYRRVALG